MTKKSSLRHLSRTSPGAAEIIDMVSALNSHSPREIVIISGAIIEKALSDLIMTHFVPFRNCSEYFQVFEGSGPASSFSSKIHLCRALGLLSHELCDGISIINQVRNAFAHSIHALDFEHSDIYEYCMRSRVAEIFPTEFSRFSFGAHSNFRYIINTDHVIVIGSKELGYRPIKDDSLVVTDENDNVIVYLSPDDNDNIRNYEEDQHYMIKKSNTDTAKIRFIRSVKMCFSLIVLTQFLLLPRKEEMFSRNGQDQYKS